MADHTNKEYAPVEVCRELSKAIKDQIAEYERELADLRERELRKNSAQMIEQGDAPANDMQLSEARKGEDFIDLKNASDREKRLKGVNHETPNVIPKSKKVSPKKHGEGGNDGTAIQSGKGLNKATVPMAKPPSGGTGLAPKAPSMAKPAAPAGGMPKPPMIAKAGARMDNPKVEHGKPAINAMAKAAIPGARPGPGTMQGDAMSASHKAAAAAAPPQAARKPITLPGRAQELASFTPAGQFSPAGAALPNAGKFSGGTFQGKKPITLPGKGKPQVSSVNPAAAHLTAPPAAVRPPAGAAPAPAPAKPAPAPMGKAELAKGMGSALRGMGAALALGACAMCAKPEHPGACPQVSAPSAAESYTGAPGKLPLCPVNLHADNQHQPECFATANPGKPVLKSESDLGACAFCGNLEHPGNC